MAPNFATLGFVWLLVCFVLFTFLKGGKFLCMPLAKKGGIFL